ncbi:MAG: pyridoxine 5'-phosphate synthase [Enterobacteriaceae bacterium]
MNKLFLGVDINYIEILKQITKPLYLNLIKIALIAEQAGANSITIHIKKKNININQKDIIILKKNIKININLKMPISDENLDFALKIKPKCCCFISEIKNKIVSKKSLNVIKKINEISLAVNLLHNNEIKTSLFIKPDLDQIDAAINIGSDYIELNTGIYSASKKTIDKKFNFNKIKMAAYYAKKKGLLVNAGHGLNYYNIKTISKIKQINELNVGISIFSKSNILGLYKSIKKIILLIK